MPVQLPPPDRASLLPVAGVSLSVVSAGIRKSGRKDLLLMRLAEGSTVAGVFTQNAFCAAPVQVCRAHLASGKAIRALVVNTGCANAGTGRQGLLNAQQTCDWVAQSLGVAAEQVLPFSTGVILEHLPMDKLQAGLVQAAAAPEADWLDAAQAIMTTDTQPKAMSRRVRLSNGEVVITGISKGAGMIRPNMATMLGYMATDAAMDTAVLAALTRAAADRSFNAITVDGDTSTNDSYVTVATGQSGVVLSPHGTGQAASDWTRFEAAWFELAEGLAQAIVRDGEGATKFMTIRVQDAGSALEARQVAYAVAHSPLVKTAFFASDPNLGRILAAVGYSGLPNFDTNLVSVRINGLLVAQDGGRAPSYTEADGQAVMAPAEIEVEIRLGRGQSSATIWTCDLSHDYVTINADYRS
ncbi:ArgJ N-acetylglutamate synthase (N-acetylornithine aminotransferase) [Burkholderiales bacterium]